MKQNGSRIVFMLLLGALGTVPTTTEQAHPNLVLVTVDELTTRALGCYTRASGREARKRLSQTPRIDSLAVSGVAFEDAHSSSTSASSTWASILLGVHSPVHGVLDVGFGPFECVQ